MKHILLVFALLALFAVLAISSMLYQSGTCDEIAHHIPAGYSYYKTGDFRLNPSNPPLSRYLMALPLLLLDLKAPFGEQCWEDADTPTFGRKFINDYNRSQANKILFLSRFPMVLIGLLAGWLTYGMAVQLYGKHAGICALFLFVLSPEVIAHATLATTDISALCFILLSIFTFLLFMKSPSTGRLILAGSALGLAELSKYSALILYPLLVALLTIELFAARQVHYTLVRKTIGIVVLSIVVIWAGYGFRMKPFLAETTNSDEKAAAVKHFAHQHLFFWNADLDAKTDFLLRRVPLPLTTYITGIAGVIKHAHEGHRTFFMGEWSQRGGPWYYAVAFFVKTPLPIILFLIGALYSIRYKKIAKDELYLLVPAAGIFFAASANALQLGIRYILPIYPLLFIFSSRIVSVANRRVAKLAIGITAIWLFCVTLNAWPHYLSYFNAASGGPNNGWKYLRDSNIDWGQDLPMLARYAEKNNITEMTVAYFGQDDPLRYGIVAKNFSEEDYKHPQDTVYAVSVQYLDTIAWTKNIQPTAKAGYSIFIYDFRTTRRHE